MLNSFERSVANQGINSLIVLCVILTFVVLLLAGCSSSSDDDDDGATENDASMTSPTADGATASEDDPIAGDESQLESDIIVDHVLIGPETAELGIGETQAFVATPVDASGDPVLEAEVVWEIVEDLGSITQDGTFTAGTRAGIFNEGVKAIATLDGVSVEAFALVTIEPGPPESIAVSEIEIIAGETQQLEVAVTDEYSNPVGDLEGIWTIFNENVGTLTETGLLMASEVVGNFIDAVQVEVVQDGTSQTAIASVAIMHGPLQQLIIAPDEADIGIEMTQQFVAVGVDQFGNRIPDLPLEWSVENGGGTIDDNGLFAANGEPDFYENTVKVTATADGTSKSILANVNVEPDRIAFISDREDDQFDVYIMNADGSDIERLTNTPDMEAGLSWSPDGRRIAYDNWGLYSGVSVMNDDGSWAMSIIQHDEIDGIYAFPSWSPDGSKIVFVELTNLMADDIEDWKTDIFVVDMDGGNLTQLTDTPDDTEWAPSWSPDGRRIAYDYTRKGQNGDIWVMNADGSNTQRLTVSSANDTHPVWSPDGSTIAFMTDRTLDYQIYVMNSDGSNERTLTANRAGFSINDTDANWSPTGSKLVFISNRDFTEEDESVEVYTMTKGGGNVKRLTEDSAVDSSPCWAPRKRGIEVSELSVMIPGASTPVEAMTPKEVTAKARGAVVRIETDLGSGSGFIIDTNGLILTNNHVVVDAEEITVYLDDGSSYEATLKNRNMTADLAAIQIEAEDLPYLGFGEVGSLELGDQLVVLGYPLNSENINMTSGFVSSVDYDKGKGITWVKTDSAINPGNSGGPLLNLQGQVVGVISLKMVSVAVEGIGYAVSANTVEGYLPSLLAEE